jgi:hypothetical protein
MHGWPWSYDPEELRRDRRCAAIILAGFTVTLAFCFGASRFGERASDVSHCEDRSAARSLAATIQALGEGGRCGDALARLPEVVPPASLRADPWGTPWSIRCHGDLAVVRSAGPDGEVETEDDVVEVAQFSSER